MTKTHKKMVQRFAKEILKSLETGKKLPWFNSRVGLCKNFRLYPVNTSREAIGSLELFGGKTWPFGDYYDNGEYDYNTLYQNPQRLEFLKNCAAGKFPC